MSFEGAHGGGGAMAGRCTGTDVTGRHKAGRGGEATGRAEPMQGQRRIEVFVYKIFRVE